MKWACPSMMLVLSGGVILTVVIVDIDGHQSLLDGGLLMGFAVRLPCQFFSSAPNAELPDIWVLEDAGDRK